MNKNAVFLTVFFLFLVMISPCPAEEIKHTVVKGDTLWDISVKYLQTPWKWPLVWANNEDISNPHLIYPGDVVVITKDGAKTVIKIIPSPERGGTESQMTMYTPEEAAAVKDRTIMVSPQYCTYIYSPNILNGSGTIVKKLGYGELISQNDMVVIKTSSDLKPGQVVTIVSKMQDITSQDKPAGYLYKVVALAKVQEVQDNIVKAVLTYSLQEVKVGNVIFDDIAPIKPLTLTVYEPSLGVPGKVIDFYGGVVASTTNDLVFLNAGKNQGVDKGAVLNVAMQTNIEEVGNKGKTVIFKEDVGMVLVLQALEDSSMALILRCLIPIEKGAIVTGKQ